MCNPTEGVPNVPFAGDCCQKSLTSQSMCKCGHIFAVHEGWSENHFSNCGHVFCGCTKFQPAPEVGEDGILTIEAVKAIEPFLAMNYWQIKPTLIKQHQVDLDRQAMQGPSLAEVKVVLAKHLIIDMGVERELTLLFAQYPRPESEAVKAERVWIINELTPYLAHTHIETPINTKTYGGSTYYDSSDCEVCKVISQLRSRQELPT